MSRIPPLAPMAQKRSELASGLHATIKAQGTLVRPRFPFPSGGIFCAADRRPGTQRGENFHCLKVWWTTLAGTTVHLVGIHRTTKVNEIQDGRGVARRGGCRAKSHTAARVRPGLVRLRDRGFARSSGGFQGEPPHGVRVFFVPRQSLLRHADGVRPSKTWRPIEVDRAVMHAIAVFCH